MKLYTTNCSQTTATNASVHIYTHAVTLLRVQHTALLARSSASRPETPARSWRLPCLSSKNSKRTLTFTHLRLHLHIQLKQWLQSCSPPGNQSLAELRLHRIHNRHKCPHSTRKITTPTTPRQLHHQSESRLQCRNNSSPTPAARPPSAPRHLPTVPAQTHNALHPPIMPAVSAVRLLPAVPPPPAQPPTSP